jgi:hypothetical protein
VSKETKAERTKRNIDLELDKELEDTFPASDPLKITRRPPEGVSTGTSSGGPPTACGGPSRAGALRSMVRAAAFASLGIQNRPK